MDRDGENPDAQRNRDETVSFIKEETEEIVPNTLTVRVDLNGRRPSIVMDIRIGEERVESFNIETKINFDDVMERRTRNLGGHNECIYGAGNRTDVMERKAGKENRMILYDDLSRILQADMSGRRDRRGDNWVCEETEHPGRYQNSHVSIRTKERGGNNVGSTNTNREAGVQ